MALAVAVFLLGAFMIFQWAIKDVTKKDDRVDWIRDKVIELKNSQSKLATKDDIAELISKLTISQKAIEESCAQVLGQVREKLEQADKKVSSLEKELDIVKVRQHSMDKKLAGVKRENVTNINVKVDPPSKPIPVTIIDTPNSRRKDAENAKKQTGKGQESLLQKAGIAP